MIGAPLGVATIFLGRWVDFALNRIADALMTLPSIFFAVAVTAALGNGLVQAMFPVGILFIPGFFRITRAATLEFAQTQYVEAAELLETAAAHNRGVFVLAATSNPEGATVQHARFDDRTVAQQIVDQAAVINRTGQAIHPGEPGSVGVVVGATVFQPPPFRGRQQLIVRNAAPQEEREP